MYIVGVKRPSYPPMYTGHSYGKCSYTIHMYSHYNEASWTTNNTRRMKGGWHPREVLLCLYINQGQTIQAQAFEIPHCTGLFCGWSYAALGVCICVAYCGYNE